MRGKRGNRTLSDEVIREVQDNSPLFLWADQLTRIVPMLLVLPYAFTARILGLGPAFGLKVTASDIDVGVLLSVVFWAGVVYVICKVLRSIGISFSSLLFTLQTGILYVEDRVAFAKADGFDSNSVSTALSPLIAFAVFWCESSGVPNPLPFIHGRGVLDFLLLVVIVKFLVQTLWLLISCQMFRFRRRNKGGRR